MLIILVLTVEVGPHSMTESELPAVSQTGKIVQFHLFLSPKLSLAVSGPPCEMLRSLSICVSEGMSCAHHAALSTAPSTQWPSYQCQSNEELINTCYDYYTVI